MFTVEIPGKPVPKARPRPGARGWYVPSAKSQEAVAMYFMQHRGRFPEGPVIVDTEFDVNPRSRADEDNLRKLVLDAMQNAGVFGNDHQVTGGTTARRIVSTGKERTVVHFGRPSFSHAESE